MGFLEFLQATGELALVAANAGLRSITTTYDEYIDRILDIVKDDIKEIKRNSLKQYVGGKIEISCIQGNSFEFNKLIIRSTLSIKSKLGDGCEVRTTTWERAYSDFDLNDYDTKSQLSNLIYESQVNDLDDLIADIEPY